MTVGTQATSPATQPGLDRDQHIPPGYSAVRHVGTTLVIAAILFGIGLWVAVPRARPTDWLLMPAFWVVANVIEWLFHRYPMHRPLTPRILYRNHAKLHHLAFTDQTMRIAETRELGLILMPWYTMLGLFVIASPVMLVAALLRGPGLAGVFLIAAVFYFLGYELLHSLYHLPESTLARLGLGSKGLFARLRAHHARHHALNRMAHVNFNVTFPLTDWILGTRERPR
jgi:hypothetical protein